MPGSSVGPVPVLRLYGVTQAGHSVMTNVHGFAPYFYVLAPQQLQAHECSVVMRAAEELMQKSAGQQNKAPRYVLAVELIEAQSILGFSDAKSKFLKLSVALPQHVATLRNKLESAAMVLPPPYGQRSYQTFEADIPFALRFMIDRKIQGASWVELPPGAYSVRPERVGGVRALFQKSSYCQYECDIAWDRLVAHAPDGEFDTIAPLRILSFDIECAGRPGVFPDASVDPVIQIASCVTLHGQSKPFIKNVFNLGTCSPIVGCQVIVCKTEQELLMRWRDFLNVVDPDVVIGYNISNFDLPYLIDRSRTLSLAPFLLLSRLRDTAVKIKDAKFSSKAYGTRESKETELFGRVVFDILQVIQRDYKLRAYSLNAVSEHFLNEQKEDVHYSIISELYHGSADDRRRLAVYCVKDALLPQRLMDKLMMMYNYIEMARVTGVPFDFLLSRGQQIKVISQLCRKAREEQLLIPYYKSEGSSADVNYEGATVIEPTRGFYEQPISTLDFASLYPSIMMAHNLCYSTLISPATVKALALVEDVDYVKTPAQAMFVRPARRQGLLPRILRELLAARSRAKAALKNEKDPFRRAVLDGRQLALKISANSVYGFTGATVGKLPCLEISGSVTAYGREMIATTKELVERQYTVENGYAHTATVIYGDTDSVMVRFGTDDLAEAMRLGNEAAKFISTHFLDPIKLEFEKVYHPYLLINKKRYAGLLWTKTDQYDKMDTKGLETIRRDNCLMVSNVVRDCLHKLLIERDVPGAVATAKSVIANLLQNKLDLSLLVISKSLSKEASAYDNKQAHVELAERMRKRDPATAPAMGDRVPYVIIKAAKGAKAYEKAEDPLYVLENDIPLDYQYYLENQLEKPLTRIFEPIMGDCAALFSGDHTRNIVVPTPKSGGIMNFAIKREVCVGCRTALASNETTVCARCRPYEAEIYQQMLATANALEQQFSRVWTQCQSCQGSFHQTVLCTSRDCPVFYARQKVQKDLKLANQSLEKFNLNW
jgi:DNA polymerase delta subunit 1